MSRIVKVAESRYGECELDVERVIALVPAKNMLLFEYAIWRLNDEDFRKVADVWRKLKDKEI